MNRPMLVDGLPRIDLAYLIECLKEKNRVSLKELIEAYQEKLLDGLCGEKRKPNDIYRRAGSGRLKTIVTPLGVVRFRTWKVKKQSTGETLTPILDVLDVRGRKYTRQMKAECAELASKLSYGDAREEYNRLTGVLIPKSTIHGFVQELAPAMLQANLNSTTPPNQSGRRMILLLDGTEVRSVQRGEFNQVHVGIGVGDAGKWLFNLTVNEPYQNLPKDSILISDGDLAFREEEPWRHQLCIIHAVKRLMFALWKERVSKEEREHLKSELERVLYTLVHSTRRHKEDGDREALRRRVRRTIRELTALAATLKRRGYREASQFIAENSRLLVTFSELALEGVRIPYTTNQIERLMGEIAKRCKHHWAHWSEKGLKNILTFILIHYTNPTLYEEYWQNYIHQNPINTAQLTTLT